MLRSILAGVLAVSLGLPGSAAGSVAIASASGSDPDAGSVPPVRVTVDTSALGPDEARTRKAIEESLVPALEQAGIAVDSDSELEVRVKVRQLGEADHDYIAAITIERGGTALEPGLTPFECLTCVTADLRDRVVEHVPELKSRLAQHSDAELVEEHREPTASGEPDPPPNDTNHEAQPTPAPIGVVGIIGIILAAGGVATAIAGGVDLGRGEVTDPQAMPGFGETTDYRRRGGALLGAGVGAAVIGAIMIGLDVGRRKKQRRDRSAAAVEVLPGPGGASIRWRF